MRPFKHSPVAPLRLALIAAILVLWPAVALAQDSLSIVVNDVDAQPVEGEAAYEVTAYVTVTDPSGQPITDLAAEDFSATQDGEAVALESAQITTRPASVILVIDTSGSMAFEGKMAAAVEAASSFLALMEADDQVGIIYFNDTVTVAQNPSTDQQAGQTIISLLAAVPDAGTCLYDAAHTAVNLAASTPPGQRAVVLLTDGIDETAAGEVCSQHTADDVIALANQTGLRVPVYTIGVGERVNADELRRIAESTGGAALVAPTAPDLTILFAVAAAQIKNQYGLTYQTATTSGEHTLTVSVSRDSVTGVGARTFIAPELPPILSLSGLDAGAILEDARAVRATISGDAAVTSVAFTLNGETLAEDSEPPYEITLDNAALEPGAHTLGVIASLDDGSELSATLDFAVAQPSAETAPASSTAPSGIILPAVIGAGVAAVVVVAVLLARRGAVGLPSGYRPAAQDAFGALTVKQSASLKKGQFFELSGKVVRVGRGEDNHVIIPDAPVSRNHAEIRQSDDGPRVFDLHSTYGTFVNNKRVDDEGTVIKEGDALKIGTRTLMRFSAIRQPEVGVSDRTMDPGAQTVMGIDQAGTMDAGDIIPHAAPTTPSKKVAGQGHDDETDQ